jgi:hypothetical protein
MRFVFLLVNCSKRGTHVTCLKGTRSHADFKCAWKGNGPELLAPIASNKNGLESNKNGLESNKNKKVMVGAIKGPLP